MSELKATPGPWHRGYKDGEDLQIRAENGCLIALVQLPDHRIRGKERREDMEYVEGSANLIAAAPDLYNALSALADAAESRGIPVDAARAALSKARGEIGE